MNSRDLFPNVIILICFSAATAAAQEVRSEPAAAPGTAAPADSRHGSPRGDPQAGAALEVSLATLPGAVRAGHPGLAAARVRVEEARARLRGAGLRPNPELETSFEHDADFREVTAGIGFSQPFPVTARLRLEKELTEAGVRLAEAEVDEAARQAVAAAEAVAVRVLALRARGDALERRKAIAAELARFTHAVAQRGEGSPIDAGQAALESLQIDLEIRQLNAETAAVRDDLRPYLGLAPGQAVEITGTLDAPILPALPAPAPHLRPDYRAALIRAEAAGRGVALEKARRRDDIKLAVNLSHGREEDAPGGLEDETRFTFGLSIPLPLWNKNEGAVQEQEALRRRLEGEAETLAREIAIAVEAAHRQMSAHAGLARIIEEELLPAAQAQVERAASAYQQGQADLQAVLRAREKAIELEAARIDAGRDFHLARVRFDAAHNGGGGGTGR